MKLSLNPIVVNADRLRRWRHCRAYLQRLELLQANDREHYAQ